MDSSVSRRAKVLSTHSEGFSAASFRAACTDVFFIFILLAHCFHSSSVLRLFVGVIYRYMGMSCVESGLLQTSALRTYTTDKYLSYRRSQLERFVLSHAAVVNMFKYEPVRVFPGQLCVPNTRKWQINISVEDCPSCPLEMQGR